MTVLRPLPRMVIGGKSYLMTNQPDPDPEAVKALIAELRAADALPVTVGPVNIVRYLADVPTEVPWLIPGFAFIGGVTLLAGAPKAGKSTLVGDMLRSMETGEPFLGRGVTGGPTLLLTEEGGIPVRHKYGDLRELDVWDRRMGVGENWVTTLNRIVDWVEEHPNGLVIIDTLSVWAGIEDENDASKVTLSLAEVMTLASYGCAILLVHHTRKGGGEHGEAIRGSGALFAVVDHSITMTYGKTDTERVLDMRGRIGTETLRVDFADGRYVEIDQHAVNLVEVEGYLEAIPDTGPGLLLTDLRVLWQLPEMKTRRRVEYLLDLGRMRSREGRSASNRPATLYWSKPPAGPRQRLESDDVDEVG